MRRYLCPALLMLVVVLIISSSSVTVSAGPPRNRLGLLEAEQIPIVSAERLAGDLTNPTSDPFNAHPFILHLKYLKVDEGKSLISMLIPDDRIKVEPMNNVLVIMGTDDDRRQVTALLAQLDLPPRQVMFEAKAIEINRADTKNIGIDWGSLTALPSELLYDSSSAFRVGLGIKNHPEYGVNIQATVNRLLENKKGRLLANPRISVLNGQTAQILIGDRLAVESRSISNGSEIVSVTYVDVGIKLEVTAFVNDDGTITTRLKPEVSNKTDATKNGNPNIRTRQAETTLRVKSGETIVLGGLIQSEETKDVLKVPLLGDIPLVGGFFRSSSFEKRETELVILITPKMID